ncbi:hypothetical protein HCA69_10670 [Listeria grandensis]|uniref:Uncharacterized protein n=1 Tax=Listeria grandensis TaxID=1494963 RepID=A0A7X1CQA6_9LIST|nr:hypothetical protein [Listeria grandensis]MBC1936832.1 hypothetical protein [Listeria grandensis]
MSVAKIIVGIVIVVYGVILANLIYYMFQTKTGLGFPVWIQVILGLCFLAVSISNLKHRHYIFGSLFASAVVLIVGSVVVNMMYS